MQIGAHVLGQHRYRAPGDDGKTGHVQDRLDDDLDMEVSHANHQALQRLVWSRAAARLLVNRAAPATLIAFGVG